MVKGTATLALLCPAVLFLCDQLVQRSPGAVKAALGEVDTSRDWSQDRFYSVYAHPLEQRVHCVALLAALPLTLVTAGVIGTMGKVGVARGAVRAGAGLGGGTLLFATLAVLLGAPVLVAQGKTLALGMLLASLSTVPLATLLGTDASAWLRVVCASSPQSEAERFALHCAAGAALCAWLGAPQSTHLSEAERLALHCAAGAALGAWLGAFPIPLDWDRPWQAWPITPAVGAALVASLALPLSAAMLLVFPPSSSHKAGKSD